MVGRSHPNRGSREPESSFLSASMRLGSLLRAFPTALPTFHVFSLSAGKGLSKSNGRCAGRCEPSSIIPTMEDHQHSIVNRPHQLIWIRDENCVCSQFLPGRVVLPCFP